MTIEERVQKGISLLNVKRPGWRDNIDWGQLSMADCGMCIIGQLFDGSYNDGNIVLFDTWAGDDDVDHGFEVEGDFEEYVELEKVWHKLAFQADIVEADEVANESLLVAVS